MTFLTLKSLCEEGRKRRSLVPCSLTLLNACLGFFAVLAASRDEYALAAFCIIVAALMDMLDGRVARALGVASQLGMELDSLCDAISFCMAPAVILYCWWGDYEPIRGLLIPLAYLTAGLVRLARFNVTDHADIAAFCGLPTPVCAIVCVLLVASYTPTVVTNRIVAGIVAVLALLMVSRIPFPSFKKYCPWLFFNTLVSMAGVALVAYHYGWHVHTMLLMLMCVYIGGGVVRGCWHLVR